MCYPSECQFDSCFMHDHIEPMVTYSMNIKIWRPILGLFQYTNCWGILTTLSHAHLALTPGLYASTETLPISSIISVGERMLEKLLDVGFI